MKKNKKEKVPFAYKAKRLIGKIFNSCIKIKTDVSFGFARNKDMVPEKTHTLGTEKYISLKTVLIGLAAIFAAVVIALSSAKIAFEIAVFKKSRKRR